MFSTRLCFRRERVVLFLLMIWQFPFSWAWALTSGVEGKFSSKLKLPIRIWKDLKETTVGSLAYVSVSFKSGKFCGEFECRLMCWSSYVVVCGRSSFFNSCFHRPQNFSSRPLSRQLGKKGEASFGCFSPHKSENRFPQWLLPCLVRLGSTPIQALCSSSSSAQFQTLCPFKISISLKLPVENSDSRRIESKIPPSTQLSSSS